MRSLVVLIAVIAATAAAPQYLVQPYSPLVELNTAQVAYPTHIQTHILKKRSVVPVAYSVPSAVSHQSRVDVRTSPAVVATAPVVESVVAPVVAEPAVVEARAFYPAPAAVSHQSRVDVRASPAVVSPVVASRAVVAQPVVARSYVPTGTVYAGGSAVTHQSRVDVETSPAIVTEEVVAPAIVESRSLVAPSVYTSVW
ncbi:uncharacterized protein LOC113521467 [Galleria mellonella]|uniref:Uncharacterized protein LOC113521467 n=1 Tax=Galleria mellonella TaxID=7137 RepID=A0A6J1X1B4_GALME|nr:uncharacterized protein LOC113521467 [Galleria mellonella]